MRAAIFEEFGKPLSIQECKRPDPGRERCGDRGQSQRHLPQ